MKRTLLFVMGLCWSALGNEAAEESKRSEQLLRTSLRRLLGGDDLSMEDRVDIVESVMVTMMLHTATYDDVVLDAIKGKSGPNVEHLKALIPSTPEDPNKCRAKAKVACKKFKKKCKWNNKEKTCNPRSHNVGKNTKLTASSSKDFQKLMDRVSALETAAEASQESYSERLSQLETALEIKDAHITDMEHERLTAANQRKALQRELSDYAELIEHQQAQIADLEGYQAVQDTRLESFEQNLSDAAERTQGLRTELDERIGEVDAKVATQSEAIAEIHSVQNEVIMEIPKLKEVIAQQEQVVSEIEVELKTEITRVSEALVSEESYNARKHLEIQNSIDSIRDTLGTGDALPKSTADTYEAARSFDDSGEEEATEEDNSNEDETGFLENAFYTVTERMQGMELALDEMVDMFEAAFGLAEEVPSRRRMLLPLSKLRDRIVELGAKLKPLKLQEVPRSIVKITQESTRVERSVENTNSCLLDYAAVQGSIYVQNFFEGCVTQSPTWNPTVPPTMSGFTYAPTASPILVPTRFPTEVPTNPPTTPAPGQYDFLANCPNGVTARRLHLRTLCRGHTGRSHLTTDINFGESHTLDECALAVASDPKCSNVFSRNDPDYCYCVPKGEFCDDTKNDHYNVYQVDCVF